MSDRRVTVRGVARFFAPYVIIVAVLIPLGLITAAVYPIR